MFINMDLNTAKSSDIIKYFKPSEKQLEIDYT